MYPNIITTKNYIGNFSKICDWDMIEKHISSYHDHITDALLGIEAISNSRLYNWENEVIHAITNHEEFSRASKEFLKSPTYGDGGMASAVRIVSIGEENE